jgi:hypothetical protein
LSELKVRELNVEEAAVMVYTPEEVDTAPLEIPNKPEPTFGIPKPNEGPVLLLAGTLLRPGAKGAEIAIEPL